MKKQKNQNIYIFCKDCYNCKIKNKEIFCKRGYFDKMKKEDILLFSPFDFNCYDWEIDD